VLEPLDENILEEVVVQVVVRLLNEATTPSSVTLQQQYKQITKAVNMKVLLTSRQDDNGELDLLCALSITLLG
jgi:hypothetical protein